MRQHQYCLARNDGPDLCTDLNAVPGKVRKEYFTGASEIQIAALQLLMRSSQIFDTAEAVFGGIEVGRILGEGRMDILESLPDDQWIREVIAWEKYVWASLQTIISDYATGPATRDPSALDHIRNDTTPGERQLCGVQRMRKSGGFMYVCYKVSI